MVLVYRKIASLLHLFSPMVCPAQHLKELKPGEDNRWDLVAVLWTPQPLMYSFTQPCCKLRNCWEHPLEKHSHDAICNHKRVVKLSSVS